jgi:hypothetical protein
LDKNEFLPKGTYAATIVSVGVECYFFVNTSQNFAGNGPWHTEAGKLCTELRGQSAMGCNDVRLAGERLYLKRTSGEVIELEPR